MKKATAKIREELTRLQEQLKQAETRDAERIGRIALKAGLGEIDVEDANLQVAFEDVAKRFREGQGSRNNGSTGKERGGAGTSGPSQTAPFRAGAPTSQVGEA